MEWEMWRSVLLICFFVVNGGRYVEADGVNKEVFDKLCKIKNGVKLLINQGGRAEVPLQEALYGKGGQDPLDNGGTFTGGSRCGLVHHGRSTYCSNLPGPRGLHGSSGHGCFGDTLLGTLLCMCVPGGDKNDLCGLGSDVTNQGSWTGEIGGYRDNHPQNLLKKVWEAIKQKCTGNKHCSKHFRTLGKFKKCCRRDKG
ncbi:unnamed protein product [Trypanosoma congolense IL3000]|uniref:WGS project CAEQ00000000 data, annotated contig 2317 n=1 Tax=Trypanosoma congolense (strain IL3000) TaxID=1068625 RepID=F9WD33_TRYCI|nr:unnamed protein product [Trypanosoma congolense IL3000]